MFVSAWKSRSRKQSKLIFGRISRKMMRKRFLDIITTLTIADVEDMKDLEKSEKKVEKRFSLFTSSHSQPVHLTWSILIKLQSLRFSQKKKVKKVIFRGLLKPVPVQSRSTIKSKTEDFVRMIRWKCRARLNCFFNDDDRSTRSH